MATHLLPLLGRGLGGGHGHMRPSFSGREKTTQACWTTREKAVVSPSPILAALPKVQGQVPDIHDDLLRPLMGCTRMELLQLGGLREPLVDRGDSAAIVPTAAVVCPRDQGIGSRQARGPIGRKSTSGFGRVKSLLKNAPAEGRSAVHPTIGIPRRDQGIGSRQAR